MNECVVCKKPISEGATHCSVSCLDQSRTLGFGERIKARTQFGDKFRDMLKMEVEPTKPSELTMIKVKHRWKRNKVETCGNVTLAFNEAGIALIPHVGNNILDVEMFINSSRGLAKIVSIGDQILEPEVQEEIVEEKVAVVEPEKVKVPEKEKADPTVKFFTEPKVEAKPEIVEEEIVEEDPVAEEVKPKVEEPKAEEVVVRKPVRPPKRH